MTHEDRPVLPAFAASRGPSAARRLERTLPRLRQARESLQREIERAEDAFLTSLEDRDAAEDNRSRIRALAKKAERGIR